MKRFISLFVSILLSAVALTWFAQNSINAYWQQTYHENSPLEPLSEYAWWRIGADWQQKAYEFSDGLKASLEAEDTLASEDSGIETTRSSENTENIEVSDNQKDSAASDAANNTDTAASEPSNQADQSATQVVLKKGNKGFLCRRLTDAGRCTFRTKTPQARIWRTIGQPQQTKYRFVLPQFLRLAENHRTNFAKRTRYPRFGCILRPQRPLGFPDG